MSLNASRKSGFTIVEMLIALAVTAVLLASVAAAVYAGLLSHKDNTHISDLIQAARVILDRITADVRTASAVDSGPQRLTIIPPANPAGLTEVEYELTGGALCYRRTVNGAQTEHLLAGDDGGLSVEAFTVGRQTAQDAEGVWYTTSVQVELTLQAGANRVSVTACACPRRNHMD